MWLYLPPACCPSSAALGDSTLDSEWRSQALERCATLKGKPSPSKSWLRAWKKGGWTRRLFGRMSRPLMAARGVAAWTSSLEAFPVSPSARQASSAAPTTSAGSGPTFSASSTSAEPTRSPSRTSPDSVRKAFDTSLETWPSAGSMRNGTPSQRSKSGRRINARGSLSWPTATTRDAGDGSALRSCTQDSPMPRIGLNMLAQRWPGWPTPRVTQAGSNSETDSRSGRSLDVEARNWPTPAACVANDGESLESWEARRQRNLAKHVNGNGQGTPLPIAALQWPGQRGQTWNTPRASECFQDPQRFREKLAELQAAGKDMAMPLSTQAADWPDPCLPPSHPSHLDHLTTLLGQLYCPPGQSWFQQRRRLNPRFVEWLMGLPPGWTDFEPAATPSSQPKQPSPSPSSQGGSDAAH